MNHYLLPVIGHLDEAEGSSAFSYENCPNCGSPRRVQHRDLRLRVVDSPAPRVTTTMAGDLLVPAEAIPRLEALGAAIDTRPARLDGDNESNWVQVIPRASVVLSVGSLRGPGVRCDLCGGVARVQFGDYPPLRLAPTPGSPPPIARIEGAPSMLVLSEVVLDLLQDFGPRLEARPMLQQEEPALPVTSSNSNWSDL